MGKRDSNADRPAQTRAGQARNPGSPGTFARWRERYIYESRFPNVAWRAAVGVVGALLVVLGLILIPFPGPGWLVVFLGLGVLATEFTWAQRLLEFARRRVRAWTTWSSRQSLVIRLVIGLAVTCAAATALLFSLRLAGSPYWVPDWVPIVA